MTQVEQIHGQKDSNRKYSYVNDIRKEFMPYTTSCRDRTGRFYLKHMRSLNNGDDIFRTY